MADKNQEIEDAGLSRRNLFHIIGSVPAIAITAGSAAAAVHDHMQMEAPAAAPTGPYKRQTFDDHQWHTVHVLCDLIFPADDQSGSASQAGVPEFLDDWLAFRTDQDDNQNLQAEIFGILMWFDRESLRLNQKNFADASLNQQKQLLDRLAYPERVAPEDVPWLAAFNEFRSLTIGGFYSSKMGVHDLRYIGNRAVAHWTGCDPKVWAIIEDRMKNGYKGLMEVKPWGAA